MLQLNKAYQSYTKQVFKESAPHVHNFRSTVLRNNLVQRKQALGRACKHSGRASPAGVLGCNTSINDQIRFFDRKDAVGSSRRRSRLKVDQDQNDRAELDKQATWAYLSKQLERLEEANATCGGLQPPAKWESLWDDSLIDEHYVKVGDGSLNGSISYSSGISSNKADEVCFESKIFDTICDLDLQTGVPYLFRMWQAGSLCSHNEMIAQIVNGMT